MGQAAAAMGAAVSRLLDWRLRRYIAKSDLPDLPEVRKMMRLAWWNGFTFGALQHRSDAAHRQAQEALRAWGRKPYDEFMADLRRQLLDQHAQRCGGTWPHPDGETCRWPLLRALDDPALPDCFD